ncbi:hypothetical protein VNO77_28965 [Canavalia gladiata]|uniref:Uncharacterized protein n=1 Tax=Canavalia gladiata TaxID=3824 RepID=A0AAN9KW48_CANGL
MKRGDSREEYLNRERRSGEDEIENQKRKWKETWQVRPKGSSPNYCELQNAALSALCCVAVRWIGTR